jgi:hypothetical protein
MLPPKARSPTRSNGDRAPANSWIAAARGVPIEREIERRGIQLRRSGKEWVGPCPLCCARKRWRSPQAAPSNLTINQSTPVVTRCSTKPTARRLHRALHI